MTFLLSDECEFLRTFRGFAARAATALFARRRIFCRSQAFATARLSCAFAVVRQSLAEPAFFWWASRTCERERPESHYTGWSNFLAGCDKSTAVSLCSFQPSGRVMGQPDMLTPIRIDAPAGAGVTIPIDMGVGRRVHEHLRLICPRKSS